MSFLRKEQSVEMTAPDYNSANSLLKSYCDTPFPYYDAHQPCSSNVSDPAVCSLTELLPTLARLLPEGGLARSGP